MQITVRWNDPELERRLEDLARQEGISLNQAAVRMLRRGAGLAEGRAQDRRIGRRLDHLAGTWSKKQAAEMDRALAIFEQIDEELWR